MSHKRKRRTEDVGLNLAAMLDMAFQLLAFFIFTFKPAPVEGQLSLHLPPAKPVASLQTAAPVNSADPDNEPVSGMNVLAISMTSTPGGEIGLLALGERRMNGLPQLEATLKSVLSEPSSTFDSVTIQVGPDLKYDALMKVIDICARQTLRDGKKLGSLSFVELTGNAL